MWPASAVLVWCGMVGKMQAQAKDGPVTVVSHVDIKPAIFLPMAEENAARLFRAETSATKQDAGLVSYVLLQEVGQQNHFTLVETWRDAAAYARHTGSDHTVRFRDEIQPFLGSPFDARVHREFR